MAVPEPRFLADGMLGKLARWLVLLGYDAEFAGGEPRPDLELLERAQAEGRVFLTRDAGMPAVAGLKVVRIPEQDFEDQLRRVLRETGLVPDLKRLFTRCTYCNRGLEALPRERALPLVPPLVRELKTDFFRCPRCSRVYWDGTHTQRTVERLRRMGLALAGGGEEPRG